MGDPITINMRQLSRGLGIPHERVQAVVDLLDAGNTVHFIVRYCRDATGSADEETVHRIQAKLEKLRMLADRKNAILRSIELQNRLTEDLAKRIREASTSKRLEDLYAPFKPKKESLAHHAKERGLELLAKEILDSEPSAADLDGRAADFVDPNKGVQSAADALLGAGHIIAEQMAEREDVRRSAREILGRDGLVTVELRKPSAAKSSGGQAATQSQSTQSQSTQQPAEASASAKQDQETPQVTGSDGEAKPDAAEVATSAVVVSADPGDGAPSSETVPPASAQEPSGEGSQPQNAPTDDTRAPETDDTRAPEAVVANENGGEAVAPTESGPAESESQAAEAERPLPADADRPSESDAVSEDAPQAGAESEPPPEAAVPPVEASGTDASQETDQERQDSSGQGGGDDPDDAESNDSPEAQSADAASVQQADSLDAAPSPAPEERTHDESTVAALNTDASANGPPEAAEKADARSTESNTSEPSAATSESADAKPAAPETPDKPKGKAPAGAEDASAGQSRSQSQKKRSRRSRKKGKGAGGRGEQKERREKEFAALAGLSEPIRKVTPKQIIEIERGEKAKSLRMVFRCDTEPIVEAVDEQCIPAEHPHRDFLRGCVRDAVERLVMPSLHKELRRDLNERAETFAVGVMGRVLQERLMTPTHAQSSVVAIAPNTKATARLVVLDRFGHVLERGYLQLTGNASRRDASRQRLVELVERFDISSIAVGSGPGHRDVETALLEIIEAHWNRDEAGRRVAYCVVNETGSNVYASGPLGRKELPGYDAALRRAVTIGRRLLDPLTELTKLEPVHILGAPYHQEIKAKHLRPQLEQVVADCVNSVGIDVNRAPASLLQYVSGLNALVAQQICDYRRENGPIRCRQQLRKIPGFGEATYRQAAGFLRIWQGRNPLDETRIHPDDYPAVERLLEKAGATIDDLRDSSRRARMIESVAQIDFDGLAEVLGMTPRKVRSELVAELRRPWPDPRTLRPGPVFRSRPVQLADLAPGQELLGTVLNVVDFGAFVDIGLKETGLVHVSRMARRFVRDASEIVAPGVVVRVWVTEVDTQRNRISLTMVAPTEERPPCEGLGDGEEGAGRERSRARRSDESGAPSRHSQQRERRGGGPREGRGRSGGRRPRGDARPKTFEMQSKKESRPLTDEMKSGDEPMRSFSDLAQFFGVNAGSGSSQGGQSGKRRGGKGQDKKPRGESPSPFSKPSESPSESKDDDAPPAEASDT